MGRSRSVSAPPAASDILNDVVRTLTQQVEALSGHVDTLAQRIQILTLAVDDVREELGWALNNDKFRGEPPPPMHITSLPRDPLAADFGEQINRFSAADLPPDEAVPTTQAQGELF
jgi:hypothetical protein